MYILCKKKPTNMQDKQYGNNNDDVVKWETGQHLVIESIKINNKVVSNTKGTAALMHNCFINTCQDLDLVNRPSKDAALSFVSLKVNFQIKFI